MSLFWGISESGKGAVFQMIQIEDFVRAARSLGRDVDDNPGQRDAVRAAMTDSMRIIAGPGSGKTTVIVLRVLKLIYVDKIDPASILVTTFTKKAAAELRSRILGWGDDLRRYLSSATAGISDEDIVWIKDINFNGVLTGTLDSLAQDILTDNRLPGETPPLMVETFVSQSIMTRYVVLGRRYYDNQALKRDLKTIKGSMPWKSMVAEMSEILVDFKDRIRHDQIDMQALAASNRPYPAMSDICSAVDVYNQTLDGASLFDFSKLEEQFLAKLRSGRLNVFLSKIRFVLVDEYQDTNLLQEQIYFQLGRAAIKNFGSVVIVGDDDQSIYRFRGATVDLFTDLPRRAGPEGINFRDIFLSANYRSTNNIVNFCNSYGLLDAGYQRARTTKPPMNFKRNGSVDFPILGLFRNDLQTLADDLANFIDSIVNGNGFRFSDGSGNSWSIERNNARGSAADIALLCSSPSEFDYKGRPRLPLLLDRALARKNPAINVFNPRGQGLQDVPEVEALCGLILECIDPDSNVQDSLDYLTDEIIDQLNIWRASANRLLVANPTMTGIKLSQFVGSWRTGRPLVKGTWDKGDVPLIELAYKLISWIPSMQDDVEGLVYLEAVCRTISQAALLSRNDSKIYFEDATNLPSFASVKEAFQNILIPLASGSIQINEDLLDTLPTDRLNIMSVHQAKGLEFPLVIVDVGSDFVDLRGGASKRFPKNGGKTCRIEDAVRPYSRGILSSGRSDKDRAFDDLIRQYFVAFSRAQDVLLLVGLNSVRNGNVRGKKVTLIPNVATGWDRTQIWMWGRGLPNLVQL